MKPKIVLSWAPHPNPLPHAVANSFVKMVKRIDAEFVIANPVGYNLNSKITDGVTVTHDQIKHSKMLTLFMLKIGRVMMNMDK